MDKDIAMLHAPKVTVLMPVLNAAAYLRQAVESILSQTFSDWELLIVDDASTDDSVALVETFTDERIRLVRNAVNCGVAATLNTGIELARGQYIARMDADDISLPTRIEEQAGYLDARPDLDVVGVKIVLVDAWGNETGYWQDDQDVATGAEIRALLPARNCLAHPGVMMRRAVALEFGYRSSVPYAQDYDLWLRITADGRRIEKLDKVLLKYRVHHNSITSKSNEKEAGLKNIRIKASFIADRVGKRLPMNSFVGDVIKALLLDIFLLAKARAKSFSFALARETLVRAGMVLGALLPLRNHSKLFFFFPFYHVGGAERVHADILKTAGGRKPWIVITHRSRNAALKEEFAESGKLIDLSALLDNVVCQALFRGYFAAVINRCGKALTFGSNTPFYYTLLPYLRDAYCVDLIHAFGGGLETISLPYVDRMDRRVVINGKTREDLNEQYAMHGVNPKLLERVDVVQNKVLVPAALPQRGRGEKLRVLYVGRGSEEKRVHLVGMIARLCHDRGLPVRFTLVGDVTDAVAAGDRQYCRFAGELHDPAQVAALYRESDLLLLTSSREGFPMVIMEAMAHGVVPAATDVGGISRHIRNGENGFLVENSADPAEIVDSFAALIERVHGDRLLLNRMSEAAYQYAAAQFGEEQFASYYQNLFQVVSQ